VPTQAAQLWLTRTEADLGWAHPGATLSGWAKPLDTYASMSHLLPMEDWPEDDRPRGLAYLCSALEDRPGAGEETVRAGVARMLEERMADLWPRAGRPGGGVPAEVWILFGLAGIAIVAWPLLRGSSLSSGRLGAAVRIGRGEQFADGPGGSRRCGRAAARGRCPTGGIAK